MGGIPPLFDSLSWGLLEIIVYPRQVEPMEANFQRVLNSKGIDGLEA